jgi:hypothetical protein
MVVLEAAKESLEMYRLWRIGGVPAQAKGRQG